LRFHAVIEFHNVEVGREFQLPLWRPLAIFAPHPAAQGITPRAERLVQKAPGAEDAK